MTMPTISLLRLEEPRPRYRMLKPRMLMSIDRSKPKKFKWKGQKLVTVGNSTGLVIGRRLLKSVDWRKGDYIQVSFDGKGETLSVRNFTAEGRKYNALHRGC
jgi:hypothetical protein